MTVTRYVLLVWFGLAGLFTFVLTAVVSWSRMSGWVRARVSARRLHREVAKVLQEVCR